MYAQPTENTFLYISKFHHKKYNGYSSQQHLIKTKDALRNMLITLLSVSVPNTANLIVMYGFI